VTNNPILMTLGLARRAGKVTYGEVSCKDAIRSTHVALVILSEDCGASTRRTFERICQEANIPILNINVTKQVLGSAIGKSMCSVVTVNNKGFADSINANAVKNK